MLCDAFLPLGISAPSPVPTERRGVTFGAIPLNPDRLSNLHRTLAHPSQPTPSTSDRQHAWFDTVATFRDPTSPVRRTLDPVLAPLIRLSPEGLQAGLETLLDGVTGEAALQVFERGWHLHERRWHLHEAPEASKVSSAPAMILLASNLPGLAVQPLLAAVALGRPTLVKSASEEPLFTPTFLAELTRREPRLAPYLAALTWRGGDRTVEDILFTGNGPVLAYGDAPALTDLRTRLGSRLRAFGPKISLALLGADADPTVAARGLAHDIALFDQRGCLSIQAVYTAGDPAPLADALADALTERARTWPPGPLDPQGAAAVRQVRDEATMRGLHQPPLPLTTGTIVVEPQTALQPSPGLRTVRIHPLPSPGHLLDSLRPMAPYLQGLATAGTLPSKLLDTLRDLGMTRIAPVGELQAADAGWENGGISLLDAFSDP